MLPRLQMLLFVPDPFPQVHMCHSGLLPIQFPPPTSDPFFWVFLLHTFKFPNPGGGRLPFVCQFFPAHSTCLNQDQSRSLGGSTVTASQQFTSPMCGLKKKQHKINSVRIILAPADPPSLLPSKRFASGRTHPYFPPPSIRSQCPLPPQITHNPPLLLLFPSKHLSPRSFRLITSNR